MLLRPCCLDRGASFVMLFGDAVLVVLLLWRRLGGAAVVLPRWRLLKQAFESSGSGPLHSQYYHLLGVLLNVCMMFY